jgi:transposase InsO family protein
MKLISNYVKMRVLGALEYAEGDSNAARYKAVSQMTFTDEDGRTHRFSPRTIEVWWYSYRKFGIATHPTRADKGTTRKVAPEQLHEAIEQVLPSFHGKKYNIAEIYRVCVQRGLLRNSRIGCTTFRRIVNRFNLLRPADHNSPKARLAFAKAHANDLWQGDTLYGPYLHSRTQPPLKTFLICFIDDASRVVPHGAFYATDDTPNLIDCFQTAVYKRGVPKAVYVDNGSNYSSKEFGMICTRLGSVVIHTPVRDGAAKGKIERFFRTVRDQFLVRDLSHISNLEGLNHEFIRWVEDTYHTREHSTLGMKPIDRFGLDLHRLHYRRWRRTGVGQRQFMSPMPKSLPASRIVPPSTSTKIARRWRGGWAARNDCQSRLRAASSAGSHSRASVPNGAMTSCRTPGSPVSNSISSSSDSCRALPAI